MKNERMPLRDKALAGALILSGVVGYCIDMARPNRLGIDGEVVLDTNSTDSVATPSTSVEP